MNFARKSTACLLACVLALAAVSVAYAEVTESAVLDEPSALESTEHGAGADIQEELESTDAQSSEPVDDGAFVVEESPSTEDESNDDVESAGDGLPQPSSSVLAFDAKASGWNRLWGAIGLDTMEAISRRGWNSSEWVVIATDREHYDALAANSLAGVLRCPVLLTNPNSLSDQTKREIQRLGAKRAYICGGPNAVSRNVDGQIRAIGCGDVRRVYGAHQQETAMEIAKLVLSMQSNKTCIIATSTTYHDALSIAPYAYSFGVPIITCTNGGNVIPEFSKSLLAASGMSNAVIVGGERAVSSSAVGQLKSIGISTVERLSGATAFETSNEIAKWELSHGMELKAPGVATGDTYHDALAGAALCGVNNSVLVVVNDGNRITLTDFISSHRQDISGGYVFGGPAAVSDSVYRTLEHCWANGYSGDYSTDDEIPYRAIYNYEFYRSKYPDVAAAFGNNRAATLNHFLNTGRRERRQGCAGFDVRSYYNQYEDLRRSYGVNWPSYYEHYRSHGEREGRAGTGCTSLNGWQFHNVPWQGQPNGYYCGPTSGTMILASAGANWSASGSPLNVWNLAKHMRTDNYGFTSFHDRMFQAGMNSWLGRNAYTTIHAPSYDQARDAVLRSYDRGLAAAVDAQERRGGPHFNGHNNGTFSHIMVVDGYNNTNDRVVIADPGARVLWAGAQEKFEYPSLNAFITTYCQNEIMGDGRQHIGMFAPL